MDRKNCDKIIAFFWFKLYFYVAKPATAVVFRGTLFSIVIHEPDEIETNIHGSIPFLPRRRTRVCGFWGADTCMDEFPVWRGVKTCNENHFQKMIFHYVEIFPRDGHFFVEIAGCRDMNVEITG